MSDNIKKDTPEVIKKWNWGAFIFGPIWGIGNNVWISLLTLIPLVNLVMIFVMGAKGNQWAWEKYESDNVEAFLKRQRKWNIAAAVYGLILAAIFVALFSTIGMMFYKINTGATKDMALAELNNNSEVVEIFGSPIEKDSLIGFSMKSKLIENGNWAKVTYLNFDIKGPNSKGRATLVLMDYMDKSDLVYMEVAQENSEPIAIIDKSNQEDVAYILSELEKTNNDEF